MSENFSLSNLPHALLIIFLRLFSYLPLPLIYCLGVVIGEIVYWLYEDRRNVTKINLTACFPNYSKPKIQWLARQHFHAMTIGVMIMIISWWSSKSRLKRLTTFRNKQILDNLMEAGENIILLAPHFVGLEFSGNMLSSQMDVTSMYQKHKNSYLDKFIFNRRTRFGANVYSYKDPTKGLIKSIRKGIPFYYLPDQDPGQNKGVFAEFFKIQTKTYPSLNKLSRLGDAKVIPCMARLRKFGVGFEIIFDPPMKDYPTGDDVVDATSMNKAIENLINYAPSQYFWSHKRFKTRPLGEEPFY